MVDSTPEAAYRAAEHKKASEVDRDGRELINVWSKGRTRLGRFLSNFTHCLIKHPVYGNFASVEGFWYWLGTGKKHHELRRLYDTSAKSAGMKLIPVPIPDEEFRREICTMIEIKVRSNPEFFQEFIESTLPFDHYFVYGDRIVRKQKHKWQMDFLEDLRKKLRREAGIATAEECETGATLEEINAALNENVAMLERLCKEVMA